MPDYAQDWIWPEGQGIGYGHRNNMELRRKLALCWHMNRHGRTAVMHFYPDKGWLYETWPGMEQAG